MTEQWLVLQAALRQLLAVIAHEPGPIRWLIIASRKILATLWM
jgi:hypothetical protein